MISIGLGCILLGGLGLGYHKPVLSLNLGLALIVGGMFYGGYSLDVVFLEWAWYKGYFVGFMMLLYSLTWLLITESSWDKEFLSVMVLVGSLLVVLSNHFMLTYLALELQTFSLFVLIASYRSSIKSNEGGLKYFILGAISSGLFLMGVSILYSMGYGLTISSSVELQAGGWARGWNYLILLSLFFKLSLFPLHFWVPDIYEASDYRTLALMGTLPKISVVGMLIQLGLFSNFLLWCALGSIVVGTFGAMNQSKFKRLLAYSGISQMGFALLTCSLFVDTGMEITCLYLTIYGMGFITVIWLLHGSNLSRISYIYDISGLSKLNMTLALSWGLLWLSMAGLPPFSGFLSKWWVIWTMVTNGYLYVGFFCVILSALGMVYYLSIMKMCYFQKLSSYAVWESVFQPTRPSTFYYLCVGGGFYFVCFLILNPKFLILSVDYCFLTFF